MIEYDLSSIHCPVPLCPLLVSSQLDSTRLDSTQCNSVQSIQFIQYTTNSSMFISNRRHKNGPFLPARIHILYIDRPVSFNYIIQSFAFATVTQIHFHRPIYHFVYPTDWNPTSIVKPSSSRWEHGPFVLKYPSPIKRPFNSKMLPDIET